MSIFSRITVLLLLGLVASVALPDESHAQITDDTGTDDGTRGAPRVYKFGTRTVAMGNATVADFTDLSSINMNPAALAFIREPDAVQYTSFQNWNNSLAIQNVTLPVLGLDRHRFGLQLGVHHNGSDYTNLLMNRPHPEPNLRMYQVDAVYSYTIEDVLSFGILNNVSVARNQNAQIWTWYNTLGMVYAPTRSISYGVTFRGLGESVTWELLDNGLTSLNRQNLREVLEMGASIQFPVDTDNTYFSLSLSNEKRFGQNGIWYKAGAEYTLWSILSLRSGLLFMPNQDIYAPRFGIGVEADPLRIDYGLSYDRDLYERYHQISLTIQL